jgi:protein TonB
LFNKLIASSRDKHRAWNSGTVVLSVAAHLVILAVILILTRPTEEVAPPPPKPEEVTYGDVTEIPPPPEPEVAPEPEPEPVQPKQPTPPRAAPRLPRKTPPVQKPTEVAGTQELKTPPVVTGIPEPSTVAPPVKAEDFGGRGAIGGTAAGTPPATPPAATTGTGSGSGTGGGTSGTYSAAMVDKRAELINREQVAKRLQQLYPPLLRDAGVTGKVTVQMVVGSDGRVDMSTVKIVSTSHEAFADATMQIMKDLRFSPAKMGSTSVRMLTVMPVSWNLNH